MILIASRPIGTGIFIWCRKQSLNDSDPLGKEMIIMMEKIKTPNGSNLDLPY